MVREKAYPSSSNTIDILMPFGVWAVYRWISGSEDMVVTTVRTMIDQLESGSKRERSPKVFLAMLREIEQVTVI